MLWDWISVLPSQWGVAALGEQSACVADGAGASPALQRSPGSQLPAALCNMGCPVLTAQIAGLVWREYRAWLPCSTLNPTREATLLHGYSKHRILNLKSWHKPRCTSLGQVSSYNLTILSDSPVARSFSRCLSFFFFANAIFSMWGLVSGLVFQFFKGRERRNLCCPLRRWMRKLIGDYLHTW